MAGAGAGGERARVLHHALRSAPAGLRRGGVAQRADRAVHHRVELAEFPFGHDAAHLLRPLGRAGRVHLDTSAAAPRALARAAAVRGGDADPAARRLPVGGRRRRWPPPCRRGAPWGTTARRWTGGGLVVLAIVLLATPAVPAGQVASSQPVAAFNYLELASGPNFHAVHMGRLLGGPPPGHLRRRANRSLRGQGAHRVHGGDEPDDRPDPVLSAFRVDYVVWAPDTPLALYLARNPRWHVVDRTSVALVFARR